MTIRQAHERPEGMDETTVIMSDLTKTKVLNSIKLATNKKSISNRIKIVSDYDVDNVSTKVVRIIYSYTDYVKRTVWKVYN